MAAHRIDASPRPDVSPRHPGKRRQIRDCEHLLAADITRLDAELFASELLGEALAQRAVDTREATATAVADLTAYATRRGTALAAVLVAALATVRDDPPLMEALDGWSAPFLTELTWASTPPPTLQKAWSLSDAYEDEVLWLLEYDDGVLAVQIQRALDSAVTAVGLMLRLPPRRSRWTSRPTSRSCTPRQSSVRSAPTTPSRTPAACSSNAGRTR